MTPFSQRSTKTCVKSATEPPILGMRPAPLGKLAETRDGGFFPVPLIKNLRRQAGEGCGFCRAPARDWRSCRAENARAYRKAIIATEEPPGNLRTTNRRDENPWKNTPCLNEELHHPHPLTLTNFPVTLEEMDITTSTCVTLHLEDPSHTVGHLSHVPMRINNLKHNEAHTPALAPRNVAMNTPTLSYSQGTGDGGGPKHHGEHLGG